MSVNSVKEDEEQKETVKFSVLFRLFKYMMKYKKQIVVVLFCIIVNLAISIIGPLLMQRAIDVEIADKNIRGLIIIVSITLAMYLAYMFISKFWMRLMAKVSNNVLMSVRDELYTHVQTLSFSFFDSRPTGKILSRIIGDVNSLKEVISETVTKLLPEFLTIIVVLVVMVILNPWLTLSAIAALPVIVLGMYVAEILAHKRWMVFRKKSSNITAFVHEDFSGIGVVQSWWMSSGLPLQERCAYPIFSALQSRFPGASEPFFYIL